MGIRVSRCRRRAWAQASISWKVVPGPKLRRITPAATRLGSFKAATTWLGLPWWQADPAEMQIPWLPRSLTMFPAGQPARDSGRM